MQVWRRSATCALPWRGARIAWRNSASRYRWLLWTLGATATVCMLTLVTALQSLVWFEQEPRAWAIRVTGPYSWMPRIDELGCCSSPALTAFLHADEELGGALRVDIRVLNLCWLWEGGDLIASLRWLPLPSSEFEEFVQALSRGRPHGATLFLAPDDAINHAQLIAFLDALIEAGVNYIGFEDVDDRCR